MLAIYKNDGKEVNRDFLYKYMESTIGSGKHLEIVRCGEEFVAIMFQDKINKRNDLALPYNKLCRKAKSIISSNTIIFQKLFDSYMKEFQFSVCIAKGKSIINIMDDLAHNIAICDDFEEDSFVSFMNVCVLIDNSIDMNGKSIEEIIINNIDDYGWRVYTTSFGVLNHYNGVKFSDAIVYGIKCRFTDVRINDKSIPVGLYHYEVAGDDDCGDTPSRIQRRVAVNFYGTIISDSKLPFEASNGCIVDTLWLNEGDFEILQSNHQDEVKEMNTNEK